MLTLIVNFKNYKEVFGTGSLRLALAAQRAARGSRAEIIVVPPHDALGLVASKVRIPVFAQSSSAASPGASTGAIVPEMLKSLGAQGTLLNHSEAPLSWNEIEEILPRAHASGLRVCLCAKTDMEVESYSSLGTEFIALEPPGLIGSGVSVSRAEPDLVRRSVRRAREAGFDGKILCGAGIIDRADVEKAIQLGVDGVLVSSSVVKAKNWGPKLKELTLPLVRKLNTRK